MWSARIVLYAKCVRSIHLLCVLCSNVYTNLLLKITVKIKRHYRMSTSEVLLGMNEYLEPTV
jgi:hypothetical protein